MRNREPVSGVLKVVACESREKGRDVRPTSVRKPRGEISAAAQPVEAELPRASIRNHEESPPIGEQTSHAPIYHYRGTFSTYSGQWTEVRLRTPIRDRNGTEDCFYVVLPLFRSNAVMSRSIFPIEVGPVPSPRGASVGLDPESHTDRKSV